MTETPLSTAHSSGSVPPSSYPSQASSSQSRQPTHPGLPPPPPPDRQPPPKGRSLQQPHRFKLGRKQKERGHQRKGSLPITGLEDDWLIEGGTTHGPSATTAPSSRRASNDMITDDGTPPVPPIPLFDSQLTEVPPRKEKKNRGRGLAKKTSQLFSRSGRDRPDSASGSISPENSLLNLPAANRQMSYSSATSGETSVSSATSGSGPRHTFAAIQRPPSTSSKTRSPRSSHSRRLSQDSSSSWQVAQKSGRSGSTSTRESPTDSNHLPIPQRQVSNLSASVPSLSRQALPQSVGSPSDGSGTLPSRMSSWFSQLLPSSSSTSAPALPSSDSNNPTSPARKPTSVAASFLNAARNRITDGARHLMDFEAQPDKCPDTMWVMGVPHPGWKPSTPGTPEQRRELPDLGGGDSTPRRGSNSSDKPSPPSKGEKGDQGTLRPAAWKRKDSGPTSPPAKGFGNLFSSSTLSLVPPGTTSGSPDKMSDVKGPVDSPSKGKKAKTEKEIIKWPEQFYDDFRSTVWCTYRSQYAPILSLPPSLLLPSPEAYFSAFAPPVDTTSNLPQPNQNQPLPSRPSTSPWSWTRGEERGLTTDAGWGCMLRTGQSVLANALIHLHLGRGWRIPSIKPSLEPTNAEEAAQLEAYATYVRIISWFMDDPSPLCPFSVHRMALIGKELGKEVGEWFGPSTAAGALKTLGNSFPLCGLSVATATDGIIYKSDVFAASNVSSDGWTDGGDTHRRLSGVTRSTTWGDKAVLILIGIRLGLDGVNPIYYDSVKALFTFPQSVGIAGGRPSSSYYFVASQSNSLFYLDPHLTRPAIPLEIPPAPTQKDDDIVKSRRLEEEPVVVDSSAGLSYTLDVVNVDDVSDEENTSESSSPSQRLRRTNRSSPAGKRLSAPTVAGPLNTSRQTPATPPRTQSSSRPSSSANPFIVPSDSETTPKSNRSSIARPKIDPQTLWYASAYPEAALRTFHCEKVKKMPLSGLDPSMLLGFLCRDQADFEDFCERVSQLPQKIFSVQEEPPSWDDDDDTGLESVSEPDMDELAEDLGSTALHGGEVDEPDMDDLGDVSGSTTVGAINIPTKQNANPNGLDDDWEEKSSTPSSQPVLIERNELLDTARLLKRPGARPLGEEDEGLTNGIGSWVRPSGSEREAPNGRGVL